MKAISISICLLGGFAATAQSDAPEKAEGTAAQPTNPPAITDTRPPLTADTPDRAPRPSDLELHPYRLFGSKRCYLTPLLRWEKLDPEQRSRTPNPMRVWRPFQGTVVQVTGPGLLLQQSNEVVFITNYPSLKRLANGQTLALHAIRIPRESHRYTNADGAERTADAFDYGIPFQPKLAPLITRTNLAALYRAQLIKSLDDQIAALENTDNQLRDQELNLKRLKSNYRQPRRAAAYEQLRINQIGAQRSAITQQIAALKKQKAQLEGTTSASGTNTDANPTTNTTVTPETSNPNAPPGNTPYPNRYPNRLRGGGGGTGSP